MRSIAKGNDNVYKLFTVSDCVRLQLPVPIRMEGSTLFWDRVCVRWWAQSPSSVRPRLHLHPSPEWIYLPVPPGDCGTLLRERLHQWTLTVSLYIYISYLFNKTRPSPFNYLTAVLSCLFSCDHQWSVLQRQPVLVDVIPTYEHQTQDCSAAAVPGFITGWHPGVHCAASQCQSRWGHSIPCWGAGFILINKWNIVFAVQNVSVLMCKKQDHYFSLRVLPPRHTLNVHSFFVSTV